MVPAVGAGAGPRPSGCSGSWSNGVPWSGTRIVATGSDRGWCRSRHWRTPPATAPDRQQPMITAPAAHLASHPNLPPQDSGARDSPVPTARCMEETRQCRVLVIRGGRDYPTRSDACSAVGYSRNLRFASLSGCDDVVVPRRAWIFGRRTADCIVSGQRAACALTTAGLFYLTNLTAPVVGYLVGARSDRTGKRLGLFRCCAVAGSLGWLAIAFSTQAWMPFVISSVVLAFGGAAASQLFAAIHDDLERTKNPVADGVTSIVRMALTAGWIVGPVVGAFLSATYGARTMLVFTAVLTFAQVLPLGFMRSTVSGTHDFDLAEAKDESERIVRSRGFRVMLPLLAFTGLSCWCMPESRSSMRICRSI